MTLSKLVAYDETMKYQLIDRMRLDCDYYLEGGNRHNKYLWANDEKEQIEIMFLLYHSVKSKPEWLSIEGIEDYAKEMNVENWSKRIHVFNGGSFGITFDIFHCLNEGIYECYVYPGDSCIDAVLLTTTKDNASVLDFLIWCMGHMYRKTED